MDSLKNSSSFIVETVVDDGEFTHCFITEDGSKKCGVEPIISQVLNNIFPNGTADLGSKTRSCCDVSKNADDADNVKRNKQHSCRNCLAVWERTLEARRRIAENIKRRTGKDTCQILFNNLDPRDERDRKMMQRLMAYAKYVEPQGVNSLKLRDYINDYRECLRHIAKAKPKLKRHETCVDSSYLISNLRTENGEDYCTYYAPHSLRCRHLQEKEQQMEASSSECIIKREIEYFPDLDSLYLCGESMPIRNWYDEYNGGNELTVRNSCFDTFFGLDVLPDFEDNEDDETMQGEGDDGDHGNTSNISDEDGSDDGSECICE